MTNLAFARRCATFWYHSASVLPPLDSAAEYAAFPRPDLPGCLMLDVHLPGANGQESHRQIAEGYHPPVVFIAGHGDIPSLYTQSGSVRSTF